MNDTIVAISTPVGEGGIGIVRLSGPRAIGIAEKIFISPDGKKVSGFKSHTVHYGHVVGARGQGQGSRKKIIDEVLLTVMRSPRTYTREDIVEINCHGGIEAMKEVLDLVLKHGARIADPGEFTRRAFLNGRIDLAQAEAVADVIAAKTEGSLRIAREQLAGGLSRELNAIREDILDISSEVEASIDFPEEAIDIKDRKEIAGRLDGVISALSGLVESYASGAILREGVLAIICGKPNVGKSSLMNLLLKRDRVIVSHLPGTTRDAVEEMINIKGIQVRLVDTAGIADHENILDKEGVKKTKKYLKDADIAIFMLDASSGIDREDMAILKLIGEKKKVVVINKCDLKNRIKPSDSRALFKGVRPVGISVEKRHNIAALEKAIVDSVFEGGYLQPEGVVVANARHKESLDRALRNMVSVKKAFSRGQSPELLAVDLREAAFNLGLILGKSVSEDILDRIFEKFCIGK